MNRDGLLTHAWADGTYTFRLAWGQLIMLQEACDCGPFILLQRMAAGAWKVEEISHVIRLGLIGGGMEPVPALKLVETYVERRPPMESAEMAIRILSEGVVGAADEDDGKKNGKATTKAKDSRRSLTAKSESPNSTVAHPSSATRRSKSTK